MSHYPYKHYRADWQRIGGHLALSGLVDAADHIRQVARGMSRLETAPISLPADAARIVEAFVAQRDIIRFYPNGTIAPAIKPPDSTYYSDGPSTRPYTPFVDATTAQAANEADCWIRDQQRRAE